MKLKPILAHARKRDPPSRDQPTIRQLFQCSLVFDLRRYWGGRKIGEVAGVQMVTNRPGHSATHHRLRSGPLGTGSNSPKRTHLWATTVGGLRSRALQKRADLILWI